MSLRAVKQILETKPTIEGAGVKLQRAFGFGKTKEFDPFLLLDDFRNENPGGLSRRISLASAPRHRDHHLRAGRRSGARRQPGQQGPHDRRRRAVDDRRQRHPAPGDAQGRRQRPHARLPAVGQPARRAQDDRSRATRTFRRAPSPKSPRTTAPGPASSAASSGARRGPVEGVAAEPAATSTSPCRRASASASRWRPRAMPSPTSLPAREPSATPPSPQAVLTESAVDPNAPPVYDAKNHSLVLFDRGDEIVVQAGPEGIRFLLVSASRSKSR